MSCVFLLCFIVVLNLTMLNLITSSLHHIIIIIVVVVVVVVDTTTTTTTTTVVGMTMCFSVALLFPCAERISSKC